MTHAYDLVVLGGGPACGPAARRCREAGWSVAVVEAGLLGGVCPHTGCNPKKVLMAAPEAMAAAAHLAGKGLSGGPALDWAALAAFKRTFTAPIDARVAEATGQAPRQGRAYRELFQLVRDALTRAEASTPQVQAIDAEDAGYTDDSRAG